MANIGTIQTALDITTDFINEEGKFSEENTNRLNRMLYDIQVMMSIELAKRDMVQNGLTEIITWFLNEYPESETKFNLCLDGTFKR